MENHVPTQLQVLMFHSFPWQGMIYYESPTKLSEGRSMKIGNVSQKKKSVSIPPHILHQTFGVFHRVFAPFDEDYQLVEWELSGFINSYITIDSDICMVSMI